VLDDATPDAGIRDTCEQIASSLPRLRYVRSEISRGFVGAYNWGLEHYREPDSDVLLLNSQTEVTPGFLEELQTILYLHERHGVASPRSNNATIYSIPSAKTGFDAAGSFAVWQEIKHLLPRYQVMPVAANGCLLIKATILNRFGLFDDSYSPGHDGADEFVCRINGYGYSAVAANWAYVFHHESLPDGLPRTSLETTRNELLLERYPEYERKISDYKRYRTDPLEMFAGLYKPHKPRILIDLFHLHAEHNGISDFGLTLLRELNRLVAHEYELYVGLSQLGRFHAHELAGYRIYEDRPGDDAKFDLAFKPAQIGSWREFWRVNRLSPRFAYVLPDIITLRCEYLNSPLLRDLFRRTAELSDFIFTISSFSRSDFASYFNLNVPMRVIHQGTYFGAASGEFREGEYVLVMGNRYIHKAVAESVRYLDEGLPVRVVGGKKESGFGSNVKWLTSGRLTRSEIRELFIGARVLVYPSHYEGFGLPIIDALALGKPVVAIDTDVNRELAAATQSHNLHRIATFEELAETVRRLFEQPAQAPEQSPRRWPEVAEEYASAFREILARGIDWEKVRDRWRLLRTLEAAAPP
jgi:glycosyltransferase involved in cell wall biosynthesis